MPVVFGDMNEFMAWDEGLPHPEWDRIEQRIHAMDSSQDHHEAWADAAREWLLFLARSMKNPNYRVRESTNFLIMSAHSVADAISLAQFAEAALKHLAMTFQLARCSESLGKFAALALADVETYYTYIAHFHVDGAYGGSGGIFVNRGYGHIVAAPASLEQLKATIIHELAHELLVNTDAPLWLQEGVAQMAEEFAPSLGQSVLLQRDDIDELRRYWSGARLEAFWSGRSFSLPNRGQKLSYLLARLMTQQLWSRDRSGLVRILHEATYEDAGDTALRQHFGESRDDVVNRILRVGI